MTDAEKSASQFNDYINSQDITNLSHMMTEDHLFIDSVNNHTKGKRACTQLWKGFFAAFPDYRNKFESLSFHDGLIVVTGRSTCSDTRLDGPAIWTVRLQGQLISEWRVLEDTTSNRSDLGLKI